MKQKYDIGSDKWELHLQILEKFQIASLQFNKIW